MDLMGTAFDRLLTKLTLECLLTAVCMVCEIWAYFYESCVVENASLLGTDLLNCSTRARLIFLATGEGSSYND